MTLKFQAVIGTAKYYAVYLRDIGNLNTSYDKISRTLINNTLGQLNTFSNLIVS